MSIVQETKYYETPVQSKGFILVKYNQQDQSSPDSASRKRSLYVSKYSREHVSPWEITESVRDEKPQNTTQARLPPTCSFCTHQPRPLFIGGMERWVSSRRMGKETHSKTHLRLMVLSKIESGAVR